MSNTLKETVTIVLPLPKRVLSPNFPSFTPGGRFAKVAATKKYRRLAKEAIEDEQIETAPWEKVRVEAIFYFKTKRERDTDNAMGSIKAAYDGIVDSGLVLKDTPEYMKRGEPEFLRDKDHPRVELTITRMTS